MEIDVQTIFEQAEYRKASKCEDYKIKKEVNVNKLIETFTDMANRESLLTGCGVSQEDLLVQIIGTIVKCAMEDSE